MGGYVCAACHTYWPCGVHTDEGHLYLKVWMPDNSELFVACFVGDHIECAMGLFCRCTCHRGAAEASTSDPVPPSNR